MPLQKNMTINAIILAAGLGTRLRPITDSIPKPLIPVCNRPLIDNILINLKNSGIHKLAVNTHHLADKIEKHLSSSRFSEDISIFHEEEILGTGGPLVNAAEVLKAGDCFVLHNCDILTDLDISKVIDFHVKKGFLATMVMTDGPENRVKVSDDFKVVDILGRLGTDQSAGRDLTYTGIMVLSDAIFKYLPDEPVNYSIITAILDQLKDAPGSVGAYIPETMYWNDLGTVEKYFKVHSDILKDKILKLPGSCDSGYDDFLGKTSQFSSYAEVDGFVSLGEGCEIDAGAYLCDCVLLEGAQVKPGEYRKEEIITSEFSLHKDIRELSDLDVLKDYELYKCRISSLADHGSDRRFYRITDAKGISKVLMLSDSSDADFDRFISIGYFLNSVSDTTPKIYDVDREQFAVLMEDLGNETIYSALKKRHHSTEFMLEKYKVILETLADFQLAANEGVKKGGAPQIRIFDYDYLRWETNYFRERFLEDHCGISKTLTSRLDSEFHNLAECVLKKHPQIFMHRDFQTHNIMLCNNKIRFVDYQGCRIGQIAYDVMSLLKDPYVEISGRLRSELLEYYLGCFNSSAPDELKMTPEAFREYCVMGGLQRNMQALGAYAFLSAVKGKKTYLQYIPRGFKYLMDGLEEFSKLENVGFKLEALSEVCLQVNLSKTKEL